MEVVLNGIKNFLQLINNNWTTIIIIIGLGIAIAKKVKNYISMSEEEKIILAKEQIKIAMLKLVSDAEKNWEDYKKAGSIKRAEVIKQIFENYPALFNVANQDELIMFIDDEIDNALKILREIIETNTNDTTTK